MQWCPQPLSRRISTYSRQGLTKHRVQVRPFRSNGPSYRHHNIASILSSSQHGDSQQPKQLEVTGHVRTIRNQKRRSFVEIGDGSTTSSLQALLDPVQAAGLGTGTAVKISGSWQPSPSGKEQSHELHARHVEILGSTEADAYPIQKKYHSSEFLRTIPHLRLRTPFSALLARLRSDCEFHISNYFRSQDFLRTHPPIITSSDCEGAGEVFSLQPRDPSQDGQEGLGGVVVSESPLFFKEPKYLTVSSQLHLEALVHEHPRVWALSPTFRAEKSDTPRHLSEFYMLEAEQRTDNLIEVMDVVEALIREVAVHVQKSTVGQELLQGDLAMDVSDQPRTPRPSLIQQRMDGLKRRYWPRITYCAAMDLLQAAESSGETKFLFKPDWSSGLRLEHEKFLAREVGCGSPVFVTDYPKVVKPFYMLGTKHDGNESPSERATVACFDLLFPDLCEVVGGSLREHSFLNLKESMQRHGLYGTDSTHGATSNLDWYLDLRRFGSVPHGGFGLGFDRLLCFLAGVENVRDTVPWPRYYGRCDG